MVNPYVRPSQNSKTERKRFTTQTRTYYTTIHYYSSLFIIIHYPPMLILPTEFAFTVHVNL